MLEENHLDEGDWGALHAFKDVSIPNSSTEECSDILTSLVEHRGHMCSVGDVVDSSGSWSGESES